MRKVIFTETQIRSILGEAASDFVLNLGDADEVPDNGYGTQVFVNNTDKDAGDDVTTTDNFSRKKNRVNRLFARTRTYESVNESNFDDFRGQNFGKSEKDTIVAQSTDKNAGKMLKNISNDIQNGGARNNTNQVRLSRLKDQKRNDPAAFARNGGEQTIKALKNSTRKVSTVNSVPETNVDNVLTDIPDARKGTGKGNNTNVVYYY